MRQTLAGTIMVLGLLMAPALAQEGGDEPLVHHNSVLAVVNDEVVTLRDLTEFIRYNRLLDERYDRAFREGTVELRKKIRESALQQIVNQRLVVQELGERWRLDPRFEGRLEQLLMKKAERRSAYKTADNLKAAAEQLGLSWKQVKQMFRDDLILQNVLLRRIGENLYIAPRELRARYRENLDRYRLPREIVFRHIVLMSARTPPSQLGIKAREIKDKLQAGEDFAELAKEYSQEFHAEEGGLHRESSEGFLPAKVEDRLWEMQPGAWEGPIETEVGVHFIQLVKIQDERVKAFASVQEEIREEIKDERRQAALERWRHELEQKAFIEYFEEDYLQGGD